MVITKLDRAAALDLVRRNLGIPPGASELAVFAAATRRASSLLGPCARATLARQTVEPLRNILSDSDAIERADVVIEALVVTGDLLELANVATEDPSAKATWVFPAPLSFTMSRGGNAYIIGITKNDQNPLPEDLRERVIFRGVSRVVTSNPTENLKDTLLTVGLPQIAESAWLKMPKQETAGAHLQHMLRKLQQQPPSGELTGLKIIDPAEAVTYYKGRWKSATNQSGAFVARRTQDYTADRWGLAQLDRGECRAFVDLPTHGSRWRGCDAAWHLQMAIDAERGRPQVFRRTDGDGFARLDFFSPLPMWSRRRLVAVGDEVAAQNCLMSFQLTTSEASAEEQILKDRLWLAKTHNGASL